MTQFPENRKKPTLDKDLDKMTRVEEAVNHLGQRFVAPLDQHDTVAIDDHRADPDDRTVGILPTHTPITLTTTRLRRCPSNSA